MRTSILLVAMFGLACASRPKVAQRPMIRVTAAGYELVNDDGGKDGKNKRVCQMEESVGSHVPKMVCTLPEDARMEHIQTQMQWDQEHGCQYSHGLCQGN